MDRLLAVISSLSIYVHDYIDPACETTRKRLVTGPLVVLSNTALLARQRTLTRQKIDLHSATDHPGAAVIRMIAFPFMAATSTPFSPCLRHSRSICEPLGEHIRQQQPDGTTLHFCAIAPSGADNATRIYIRCAHVSCRLKKWYRSVLFSARRTNRRQAAVPPSAEVAAPAAALRWRSPPDGDLRTHSPALWITKRRSQPAAQITVPWVTE